MAHLTQLMREKKPGMHFGSLIMSFGLIIGIKKVPSLVSFITSTAFNDSFRVKNHIYLI